ncbi:hypothetical protein KKC17_00010 [Patescibacteria group bacterium]|nr:hypothetical protein [Patescibacteria group bacterium]
MLSYFSKILKKVLAYFKALNQPEQSSLPLVWPKVKHHSRRAYHKTKDCLIPHSGNNHLPQVLKHRFLMFYSALLVILKVLVIILPVALPSSSLYSSAITLQNIVDLTNQTRINLGIGELQVNDLLNKAAQAKANDMLLNQYFAHVSPNNITPWDWIENSGYDYRLAGENLAVHFQEAEEVQAGWLASPTHRANIVNSRYSEIGIGIARGQFEQADSVIVVQMFGQPMVNQVKEIKKEAVAIKQNLPQVKEEIKTVPLDIKPVAPKVESLVQVKKPVEKPEVKTVKVTELLPKEVTVDSGFVGLGNSSDNLQVTSQEVEVFKPAAPVIYESSLKIKQSLDFYNVKLAVTGATAVALRLGEEWVMMGLDGPGSVWQAEVPFNNLSFNISGEQLSVVAWADNGLVANKALALLLPQSQVQQFYTFNEGTNKYANFFGFFTVHNLQDKVSQFYLFFMVFLGAALLLNIFIKIRIQHYSVISHALAVIALALLLIVI